jgi:hypothetical protein
MDIFAESMENGQSNTEYLQRRGKENENLPDSLKHKTLRDIWSKEVSGMTMIMINFFALEN